MIMFETETYMKSYELQGYLLPPVTFSSGFHSVIPSLFHSDFNLRQEKIIDFNKF